MVFTKVRCCRGPIVLPILTVSHATRTCCTRRYVRLKSIVPAGFWQWSHNGSSYRIRYQRAGTEGPHAVLIHGFGGNW